MSTIKSSDEHLTLNADGTSKDIKFQANGVEKASISSAGAFTSTTIDATKLTGDLPAISGANLTGVGVAGITSSADATAITIDSSENVGIGTTPESGQGSNSQGLYVGTHASVISNGAYESVSVSENAYLGTAANDTWKYRDTSHAARHEMKAGVHTFKVAASGTADADITWTDAMTIDNNGKSRFAKGVNPAVIDSSQAFEFLFAGSSDAGIAIGATANPNSTGFLSFRRSTTTQIGSVYRNGTSDAVVYSTSSDYRLKDNITDITDGITRVKQLQPRKFSWKNDSNNTIQDGFIAHEVSDIVPEAIGGTKDAVKTLNKVVVNNENDIIAFDIEEADWTSGKENGQYPSDSTWEASKEQIVSQSMDYGLVTPLLTAALKEAIAKIEALEARVAALEA